MFPPLEPPAQPGVPVVSRRRAQTLVYEQKQTHKLINEVVGQSAIARNTEIRLEMPFHGGNTGSNPVGDANNIR